MSFRVCAAWVGLVIALGGSRPAEASLPIGSLRFTIGFGVEEKASPERDILALWKHYLTEPSDSIRATLWSASERTAGSGYDLVGPYVYQGFIHVTVVEVGPAAGLPQTYVIRTLVTEVDDSTLDVRPLALYRVYATLEKGRWVLANALPRTTRAWHRSRIGAITFVYPPGHEFDERRARSTSAFVDSLAKAFELPAPTPITDYLTDDLAETLRALGLEFFPLGGNPVGGRSNVPQRQVFVGSSTHAEAYRHELSHIVLAPLVSSATHGLVMEGLMTWTGGSAGLDVSELLPPLARYLADRPKLSLQSVLENPPPRTGTLDVGYDGLAVLCKMVYERRGLRGLRRLLAAGRDPSTIVSTTARVLGVSPAELNVMWRNACGVR
jgi:hypothetical protein